MMETFFLTDHTEITISDIDEIFVTDSNMIEVEYPKGIKKVDRYEVECEIRMKNGEIIKGDYIADSIELPGVNYSYANKDLII